MYSSLTRVVGTDVFDLMAIDATPITASSVLSQSFLRAKLFYTFLRIKLNNSVF